MKQYSKISSIMLLCLSFTLNACGEKPDTTNTSIPNISSAPVMSDTAPVEQKITAQELAKDYAENKEAANTKYKGKKIELTGIIKTIEMGISDLPELVLETATNNKIESPRIEFASSQTNQIEKLQPQQKIHIICQGNGEIAGMPLLTECTIKQSH